MADPKGIVGAFRPFRETADPLVFAVAGKLVPAAGEDLVAIGLMTDVPDKLIIGRIKHIVQRHGQLGNAKAGREMAAVDTYGVDNKLTELIAQLVELLPAQSSEIRGRIYRLEQGSGGNFHSLVL